MLNNFLRISLAKTAGNQKTHDTNNFKKVTPQPLHKTNEIVKAEKNPRIEKQDQRKQSSTAVPPKLMFAVGSSTSPLGNRTSGT